MNAQDFSQLTPIEMMSAVENALDCRLSGLAAPFASYINRVCEFQTEGGERIVAKFYRPGRWSRAALQDEHNFVLDCAAADIPVIPPMPLADGSTLGCFDGIYFAVFPRKGGRPPHSDDEECWNRFGALLGRMHVVGAQRDAPNRLILSPEDTTEHYVEQLLDGDFVSPGSRRDFALVTDELLDAIFEAFDDEFEFQRVHGDLHYANILERPDEGLMLIDFDDMLNAPTIQDFWLLLPGHYPDCRRELDLMLDGYLQFRDFDFNSLKLIEPLRAMRIIYFLAWCSTQANDYDFSRHFPDWGSEQFWRREVTDLRKQLALLG